ncbi:MAG: hypothetical protein ACK44M_15110, partial [Chloroflexus sp.]
MALQQSEQANAELQQIKQGLEQQVAPRTSDLRQTVNQLKAQSYSPRCAGARLAGGEGKRS